MVGIESISSCSNFTEIFGTGLLYNGIPYWARTLSGIAGNINHAPNNKLKRQIIYLNICTVISIKNSNDIRLPRTAAGAPHLASLEPSFARLNPSKIAT